MTSSANLIQNTNLLFPLNPQSLVSTGLVSTGNITAPSANINQITGTIETGAQPNITLTGTLTGLNVINNQVLLAPPVPNNTNIIRFAQSITGASKGFVGFAQNADPDLTLYSESHVNVGGASGVKLINIPNASTANTLYFNTSNNSVSYDSSSIRFKENIQPLVLDPSKLYDLQPKSFDYKESKSHEIGYIAEDLVAIGLNEFVGFDANGLPEGIKYIKLVMLLVEELKLLKNRIVALEAV